jgi:hypothetical protein
VADDRGAAAARQCVATSDCDCQALLETFEGLDRSSDPHVFSPLLGDDEWIHAEPLVIVFDGDHYKPLSCSGTWSIDFNRVGVDFQQASPALVAAFEPLRQRGLCGEIRTGCMLDDAAQ